MIVCFEKSMLRDHYLKLIIQIDMGNRYNKIVQVNNL